MILSKPPHLGRAHRADDAARRAREDRVLALEAVRIGQAAVRLHEQEPRRAELGRDLIDIAAQDRREIGIDHGGVAAADELHQRADAVAHGDLGEADVARELGDQPLHARDSDSRAAARSRRRGCPRRRRLRDPARTAPAIGRPQHLALGGHALVDLDDALVELFRQDDVAGEELRPVLVADAQRVGEALGDDQAACARPCAPSSALVATVVPILTASIAPGGSGASGATPRMSRMPASAASR